MRFVRLAGLVAVTCAGVAAGYEDSRPDESDSILFVGNSFTYWHGGVEEQVIALAAVKSPARTIVADVSTMPGAALKLHYGINEPEFFIGALHEPREGDRDVVVLQGDIPEDHEWDVGTFLEYARLFDAEIRVVFPH